MKKRWKQLISQVWGTFKIYLVLLKTLWLVHWQHWCFFIFFWFWNHFSANPTGKTTSSMLFWFSNVCLNADDAKGIPEFWLTALKNVDTLADMIQVGLPVVCGWDFLLSTCWIMSYAGAHTSSVTACFKCLDLKILLSCENIWDVW